MKKNQATLCLATILCAGLAGAAQAQDMSQSSSAQKSHQDKTTTYQQHQNDWQKSRQTTSATQPAKFNKASSLIGMKVKNQMNDELGEIKDLVIDPQGRVSYAVLSTGGTLGMNEKLLAVPFTAFTHGSDQNHLVLNADQSSISSAQGIGDAWPSVQNPSFGAQPFWQGSETNLHPGSENQYNSAAEKFKRGQNQYPERQKQRNQDQNRQNEGY